MIFNNPDPLFRGNINANKLSAWFPTLVYKTNIAEVLSGDYNKKLYDKAKEYQETYKTNSTEWRCDTFNTLDNVDLTNEPLFEELIKFCKLHVVEFSREFGPKVNQKTGIPDVVCDSAWINITPPGEYQEYHYHSSSHFSLVYYIKTPENCGDLVLRSHESHMNMFPLPVMRKVVANTSTCSFTPIESQLVIFRSNIMHMAEKNKSNEDRISVAMNFTIT